MFEAILAIALICGTISLICATILLIILLVEHIQEHKMEREKMKKEKESNKSLW